MARLKAHHIVVSCIIREHSSMNMYVLLISFLFLSAAIASEWETVHIPYAKCGDGVQYRVFYKEGAKDKLAIELMSGGACWSAGTCWGPNFRTWIHPIPQFPSYSYLTSQESPIRDHTFVYFPYCNGDVFAGDHEANYLPIFKTYHQGSRNLRLAISHLEQTKKLNFTNQKQFVLTGSSAGGIGSLVHRRFFDKLIPKDSKKFLIADSVGLHYGKNFWKKFSPELLEDFHKTFSDAGLVIDEKDGMIAPQLKKYCQYSRGWKIGFVQTTQDIVMSKLFGDISQAEHRRLVLAPNGMRETLKNSKVCETHISEGQGHLILLVKKFADEAIDIDSGETAIQFVDRILTEN